jgi:arylsulfatase A-like enzyme
MTMLTSVEPCVHGLDTTAWSAARRVHDGLVTLAEVLRGAGYDTAAFTENAWVTAALGYDRGFATFVEDSGVALDRGNIEATFARALEWIGRERSKPFFVFVHTYQVHEPYTPPAGYLEKVAPEHGQDRASVDAARYDAEIRYTDDVVARFLTALDERGLSDDTLVVLTADHGQHFGEHQVYGHGQTLYDSLLHVPLLLRGPGVPAGKRVSDSVGLIDLMPTVLDLLGMPRPPGLQGLSLTGALRGEKLPERTLFAELSERGLLAARQGDRKLLLDRKTGRHAAYEYRSDPGEKRDLAKAVAPDEWTAMLEAHDHHCKTALASLESAPSRAAIDAKVRGKLEALGYVE